MLDEDELQALADDIRDLGQLQPIVLDSSGRILDGRNRLRACELAEVEPEYITYSGTNPSAYTLSVNLRRRSLSHGPGPVIAAHGG
ncbi:ParB N-terminal domain-containing protein [Streptomyces olivaceus]|uniref:ParB N-terminal domain-containing protein n=1 Tax=Streptomyces olivaceus TaxID=47716 RepID=UPI003648F497